MTNIVVVDDVVCNDAQSERLNGLGRLRVYSALPPNRDELFARLHDADVCIVGWSSLDDELLRSLPRLKMVSIWATGTNYVDLNAARECGIVVSNVPAYAANAVAEMCIGFMIALARSFLPADRHVRAGAYRWQDFRGSELAGKTLGIIGVGSIGSKLSGLARAMGLNVIAHTLHPSPKRSEELGVAFVEDIDELIAASDFVSLNCALSESTRGLLDDRRLGLLRPSAFLVNTARAGLVDQASLVRRLRDRSFAGAALDDIDIDAPDIQQLFDLPNVLLSPHSGFHTAEAVQVKTDICIANVAAFLAGDPVNIV